MPTFKMPLSEALAVSLIGIVTVMVILAVIACLIIIVSKVIRAIEAAVSKKAPDAAVPTPPTVSPAAEGINNGSVELIGTAEKEAAVIMAIVSDKSGIPLNRLNFKAIKFLDDEKKGDK